jgi:hypothetical protein
MQAGQPRSTVLDEPHWGPVWAPFAIKGLLQGSSYGVRP